MHCSNCGKDIADNVKFCDGCGSPVVSEQTNTQGTQKATVQAGSQDNKVIFILAYFGILFFLPLVSCPNSKEGRFHANQGLLLLITSVAGQIAVAILSAILIAISWRLALISSLLYWAWAIVIIALVVIGIVNANKGNLKPLPVIGKIKIIK